MPDLFCTIPPRGAPRRLELSGNGHLAVLNYSAFSECCPMVVDGEEFEILRHTEPERFWTMGKDAETLFRAGKMGFFSRTFEISGVGGDAVLKGVSALGRTMVVKGPQIDCAISTEFCWSRRIAVRGIWEDFRFVAFAFWLSYQTRISRWG